MFDWFKRKVEVRYKVIEVKAPRSAQAWTKETKDAVGTLAHHPGSLP